MSAAAVPMPAVLPDLADPLRPIEIDGLPARAVPLFCFLHVPKTAGSSVRWALKWMFGDHARFFRTAEEVAPTEANLAGWRDPSFYNRHLLIGGHVQRSHPIMSPEPPPRRMVYLALFRDPVRRAVSWYDFARRYEGHPLQDELRDRSLLQAVTLPGQFRDRLPDEQMRYAFGTGDPPEAARRLRAGSYIVAPTDRLDGFLDALSAVSGLARPPRVPRRNEAGALDAVPVPLAREQPDYEAALEAIGELCRAETAFLREHVPDVVVTTSLTPVRGPGMGERR